MEIQTAQSVLLKILLLFLCYFQVVICLRLGDISSWVNPNDQFDERIGATQSVYNSPSDSNVHKIRHVRAKVAHRAFLTHSVVRTSPKSGEHSHTEESDLPNHSTPESFRAQSQPPVIDNSKLNYTSVMMQTVSSSSQEHPTPLQSMLATVLTTRSLPTSTDATADNEQMAAIQTTVKTTLSNSPTPPVSTNTHVVSQLRSSHTPLETDPNSSLPETTHNPNPNGLKDMAAVYTTTPPVVSHNGALIEVTHKPEQSDEMSRRLTDGHQTTPAGFRSEFPSEDSDIKTQTASDLKNDSVLTSQNRNNFLLMTTERLHQSLNGYHVSDKTAQWNSQNVTTASYNLEAQMTNDSSLKTTSNSLFTTETNFQTTGSKNPFQALTSRSTLRPTMGANTWKMTTNSNTKKPLEVTTSSSIENSNVVTSPHEISLTSPETDLEIVSHATDSVTEGVGDSWSSGGTRVPVTETSSVNEQTNRMALPTSVPGRNETINPKEITSDSNATTLGFPHNDNNLSTSVLTTDGALSDVTDAVNGSPVENATAPIVPTNASDETLLPQTATAEVTTSANNVTLVNTNSFTEKVKNYTANGTSGTTETITDYQVNTTTLPGVITTSTSYPSEDDVTFPTNSGGETSASETTTRHVTTGSNKTGSVSTEATLISELTSPPTVRLTERLSTIISNNTKTVTTYALPLSTQTSADRSDTDQPRSTDSQTMALFSDQWTTSQTTAPDSVQQFIVNWDKLWLFILISCCVLVATLLVFLLALVIFFTLRRKSPSKRSHYPKGPKNHPFIDRDLMYSTEVGNTSEGEEVTFGTFGKSRGRDRVMISGSSEKITNSFSAPGVDFIRIKQLPHRFNGKKAEYV